MLGAQQCGGAGVPDAVTALSAKPKEAVEVESLLKERETMAAQMAAQQAQMEALQQALLQQEERMQSALKHQQAAQLKERGEKEVLYNMVQQQFAARSAASGDGADGTPEIPPPETEGVANFKRRSVPTFASSV
jgi:hypothetical protein